MQDLKNRDAEKKDKEINTSQSADEEGELCPICYADVHIPLLPSSAHGAAVSDPQPNDPPPGDQYHVFAVQASVVQEVHPEAHAAEQDVLLLQG